MEHDSATRTGADMGDCVGPILTDLPWEIVVSVASHMHPDDLCRLGSCCRMLSAVRNDSHVWRRIAQPSFSQALLDHLGDRAARGHGVDWRRHYYTRRDMPHTVSEGRDGRVMGQRVAFMADGAVCVQRGVFARASDRTDAVAFGPPTCARDTIDRQALVLLSPAPPEAENGTAPRDEGLIDEENKTPDNRHYIFVDYASRPALPGDGSLLVDGRSGDSTEPPPVRLRRYANGDVHAYIITGNDDGDGGRPHTLWFRISPQNKNRAAAGRVVCRAGWKDIVLTVGAEGRRLHVFYPLGGVKAPSERVLFDWYVLYGGIGWDAETRVFYPSVIHPSKWPQEVGWTAPPEHAPTADDRRPWLARARAEPYVYDPMRLPSPWADVPCAITGTTEHSRGMHAILSDGTVVAPRHMVEFSRALWRHRLPPFNPITDQLVYSAAGFSLPWHMDSLDPRWATAAVAAAYRRLWTLIADGADLLACCPELAVSSLVTIAALDAHVCDAPRFRDDDPAWTAHSAHFAAQLRNGIVEPVARDLYAGVATSYALARLADVDVPAPAGGSGDAVPGDWHVIAASPTCPLKFVEGGSGFHRARLERLTFVDRTFRATTFAGATLDGCRFTRCIFTHAVFVDAIVRDCSFVDCAFMVACQQRKAIILRVDGSVSRLLTRLGCHRVVDVAGHA
ncbi:Pentapeptide 4 domain containing protein [Pandoravirus dulcis]|uniref:Pentapeptide 4 domain containing protein n=1 Tax=Pandoravirus dulcis TaxID=1349409 RepID=S4VPC9_9VIRU|nr:Pentapeptide 4 domain containing protein [Pandoravirus dulcis]AGO82153.1 Pentapeptide 4 domain containing protein [Pandoravirus dulcis]